MQQNNNSPRVHFKKYQVLDGSTRTLVERVGDGSIITRFDKTPFPRGNNDVVCPHFLELKWATGCPYSCAWCYLQGTLRFQAYKAKPHPKDFSKIGQHLTALFEGDGIRPELLNAGELSDSMISEHRKTPFSKFIMGLTSNQQQHKILFVTKSHHIDNLLSIDNPHQAVVSFSLNAGQVAAKWEKAPPITKRIEAASRLKHAGFETRIRIDPMVPIDNWEKAYGDLIDSLMSRFEPDRITLGSLRGLQSTINNARDKTWTKYLNEQSNWGKKIPTEIRKEMYTTTIRQLKRNYNYKSIALCKETVAMWNTLGMNYKKIQCNCLP